MESKSVNALALRKEVVKKDIVIAITAVLVVLAVTFGLAQMRPDGPNSPSRPFSGKSGEASEKSGKVIIRVNGDPITEDEFNAFLGALPEQQRPMYTTPAGRRELANELVRMKALEQEAKRLNLTDDEQFQRQLDLLRSQFTAQHALQKIVEKQAESQIKAEYEKQKTSAVNLRHIVVGYEGGMIPARGQNKLPSSDEAMRKASGIVTRLRGGADFAQVARTDSDDVQSGAQGGSLGPLRADGLPPEVASVVTKMKPGEISDPVKTQFGIHIFNVSEPTLDELRPALLQKVQQEIAAKEMDRLQKAAKVDLDPQFFPPAPAAPAGAGAPGGAAPAPRPQQ
jgi:peptidyl-prolyl cis-trans isomerase C